MWVDWVKFWDLDTTLDLDDIGDVQDGTHGTCKGNPNASNSSLCGAMDWACGPNQNYVDIKVIILKHLSPNLRKMSFQPAVLVQRLLL